jgi:hypothetical protein
MASDGGDEVCFMLRLLYPLRSKSPIPTGQKNESAQDAVGKRKIPGTNRN